MARDFLLLAGTIGRAAVLAVLALREMRRLRLQRFAGRESWRGSELYRLRPAWRTIQTLDDLIRHVAAGVSAGPD